ncbi:OLIGOPEPTIDE ABC TRANSPORTER PERMEASE PROTEIN [Mycoplasmopsis pulmonis]|uniref:OLIGOPEPTIDE ABC TRANSPORTER PERMEASE PROTEIN n=1 Tax=Mycoplasmopsis pulmonis (strain UAB CTIP) TaxID=272635 RepID=Q98QS8_MYCPU|nr:ABC transporter permease [Mycoplasmopsis pulmonis]MDZ7293242.1 ABC transporter permease [Mycoplasmopsis pulmonis]CAC13456.1 OLIGOPEPTIDE ABC TRANSPORTER PERMEASE PROTEIN [Mycoplasmopsis pulmonis]VEU68044.1 oligopeptide ABC transporter permease [Mycoplasmopsis pulmonis]
MISYLSKRLGLFIFTFFIILFVVYVFQASFGNIPFSQGIQEPPRGSDELQRLNSQLKLHGFDKPVIVRFFTWFFNLLKGDFGISYVSKIELPKDVFSRLKWSIFISLPAFIFSVIIGVSLGTLAAYKRASAIDTSINAFSTFFSAVPSFVLAPFIIIFFAKVFNLPWSFREVDAETGITFAETIRSSIAPIFVFTITNISGYVIISRNQIVQVLTSNQVLIAKSKGLTTFQIFRKHVLRNASLPLAAAIIPSYLFILSGSIVLESLFNIPGNAQNILDATKKGEINVIMFNVVFFTGLSMLTQILVDIIFVILDPRIKIYSSSRWNLKKRIQSFITRKNILVQLQRRANGRK